MRWQYKCSVCGCTVETQSAVINVTCGPCLIKAAKNSSKLRNMFTKTRDKLLNQFAFVMTQFPRHELVFSIRYGEENDRGGLRLQASITAPGEPVPGTVWDTDYRN